MKKVIISVMLAACVALLAVCMLLYRNMDKNAPEISVPDTQITYTEGDPEEALLKGVTAFDEEDGDVSDSLQVEAIRTLQGDKQAVVVYVAKDKSNNIATENRTIDYIAKTEKIGVNKTEETPTPTEKVSDPNAESGEPGDVQQPENEGEVTVDPVAEEAAAQAAAEAQFEALPNGSPRLILSATKVAVAAGESFVPLNYVKEITDDEDKREELFRRIQISGEYDLSTPGTYELVFYVLDSDQNQSNQATLSLIVQ